MLRTHVATPQAEVRAVRRSGNQVELDLYIPKTLELFRAHFPRFGILPGVVQVDWAMNYGREHLEIAGTFKRLRRLKFLHPILPGATIVLSLTCESPGTLAFTYRNSERACSSGCADFKHD